MTSEHDGTGRGCEKKNICTIQNSNSFNGVFWAQIKETLHILQASVNV
jgi:hypothetical protein